jgi:hypothetical protein
LEAGNMRTKTERLKWLGIFMAAMVSPGLVRARDIGAPDPEVIEELGNLSSHNALTSS